MKRLDVPFLVDNLIVNEYDQLVAAGHPNVISFLFHAKDPRTNRAPSEIVIFRQPTSSIYFNVLC